MSGAGNAGVFDAPTILQIMPPLKCLSFPRDIECLKCCSILRWSGGGWEED